jgi:hypothetical protein
VLEGLETARQRMATRLLLMLGKSLHRIRVGIPTCGESLQREIPTTEISHTANNYNILSRMFCFGTSEAEWVDITFDSLGLNGT